jgi:thiamine kinase-like enzyme
VPDLLDDYAQIVRARGHSVPRQYALAQSLVRRIAGALPLTEPVPCHDDLLAANVLARKAAPERIVLVDWEYAGMGHHLFDLGNLAVNNEFDAAADQRLLLAYFGESPDRARLSGLALMRIMSDAREAAWGVVQSAISDLRFDFDGYSRRHFARLEQAAADPRFDSWLADAAPA